MRYGSDLIVEHLAKLGIELVTLNPGATIRGLHDSLVRNNDLTMTLALHEEIAVAMAHGYAKSSGRVPAVFIHDLVGLQHASMAIFNAWADNVPMLVIGGSGPRDAARRRPWIDWVHTGLPQGSLVRDFVKWDDEPTSLEAVADSLTRGLEIATRGPAGPVYISIDTSLQEQLAGDVVFPDPPVVRASTIRVSAEATAEAASALRGASSPVVVVDLPQAGLAAALTDLADVSPITVVDLGAGANFPTDHPANESLRRKDVLGEADLVIALDVRDLQWATAETNERTRTITSFVRDGVPVISVALAELHTRGFIAARSYLPTASNLVGDPASFVRELTAALAGDSGSQPPVRVNASAQVREGLWKQARAYADADEIHPAFLAATLWDVVAEGPWQLANGKLDNWINRLWTFSEDSHFLGLSGGHGLGYGMPASLGAAFAQRESDSLVVNLQGDGDLMYTSSALWTAARYQLPLLTVVHNNRSYGKDEIHQREIAVTRDRSADVVGLGIELGEPDIDYASLAQSQGMQGFGPVSRPDELASVLREAARLVREERRPVLVDVVCPMVIPVRG